MLTNQFNGLIEPASSYKTTDISNGVQKYMDDIEEIVEERIKRVRRPLSTLVPTLPTPAQRALCVESTRVTLSAWLLTQPNLAAGHCPEGL